jgi:AcrR family transcriptional regulator
MQDLFDEAGLSAGAVYGYFKSKEDIVLAIAEDSLGEMISTVHAFATSRQGEGRWSVATPRTSWGPSPCSDGPRRSATQVWPNGPVGCWSRCGTT